MKKYIKLIVILVIIMTIYSIFVVIISKKIGKVEPKSTETKSNTEVEKKEEEKVSIGDYVFAFDAQMYINYKNGNWYEYSGFDYSNKKFDVYINNELLGKYKLNYGGRWYIYGDDSDYVDYDGNFMAVFTNLKYNIVPTISNQFDIVDQSNISSFLTDLSISFDFNDINKSKILYDVNRDGLKDIIYFVSNAFSENTDSYNNSFAYVFVKYATGDVKNIYSFKESKDSIMSMANPSFGSIIDIDGKQYLLVFNEKNSGIVNYYIYNMGDSFRLMFNTNIK